MNNFSGGMVVDVRRFNFSMSESNVPEKAQKLYGKNRDYRYYYDNLCLYCANNNVDIEEITDETFDSLVKVISDYKKDKIDTFYFWID